LDEPVRPPLVLGDDPGPQTAAVPGETDDAERKDLDVRRAADEREPGADLPAGASTTATSRSRSTTGLLQCRSTWSVDQIGVPR